MADTPKHCGFCGKHASEVKDLIVGQEAAICSECVLGCARTIFNMRLTATIPFPTAFTTPGAAFIPGKVSDDDA